MFDWWVVFLQVIFIVRLQKPKETIIKEKTNKFLFLVLQVHKIKQIKGKPPHVLREAHSEYTCSLDHDDT